ncbi:MAG TPA: beta-1,6-N-acetylglucosaminyltransferase [Bacteroidales bacterium]|nr:beta-1,6-N-acetylglucosaminyltransferase [Bacteroidales bacterium]HPS15961.1 beta-1,6-N-acetylglucosaminyltransferase [Bacteroidales bacterium]
MNHAFVILAHKNPEQVKRLLNVLCKSNFYFFVHICKNSNINEFEFLYKQNNVTLLKRENGSWGRIGIVKATINGLKAISKSHIDFEYIHLISGQDYPIRDIDSIELFFKKNRGYSFIEFFSLPSKFLFYEGMDRIEKYHFGNRIHPSKWDKKRNDFFNTLSMKISFFRRKIPKGLKPFAGSQWWSLHIDAVNYILRFLKDNRSFIRFHRFSKLSDEMFFQTILLNSHDNDFIGKLVNNSLRYIDWDKPNVYHPATIKMEDYEKIKKTDKLFARKFDIKEDSEILDLLDKDFF